MKNFLALLFLLIFSTDSFGQRLIKDADTRFGTGSNVNTYLNFNLGLAGMPGFRWDQAISQLEMSTDGATWVPIASQDYVAAQFVGIATTARQDAQTALLTTIDTSASSVNTKLTTTNSSLSSIDGKFTTLNAKDFATSAKQDAAKTVLDNILSAFSPLSTAANQSTANTSLSSIDGKLTTLNAKDFATSAKQDTQTAIMQDVLASGSITTQNLNATSGTATAGSTVEATVNGHNLALIQVTGTYTGALTIQGTVDGSNWVSLVGTVVTRSTGAIGSTITSAATGLFQARCAGMVKIRVSALAAVTGTAVVSVNLSKSGSTLIDSPVALVSTTYATSATQLPATLGQKAMTASMAVVVASDQSAIAVTPSALTGTYSEIVNLTNVAQTLTAPAGAKWAKIQADNTNTANIRWKIGATATTTSGMQLEPGRAEDISGLGNISVICETSATSQKVYVQWGN